jgi:hypothetical protein
MDHELPTWMFASDLGFCVSLANDLKHIPSVRSVMAERAADLLDNWLIDDKQCRRIRKDYFKPTNGG